MTALVAHLANPPAGAVLFALIVAALAFFAAAVASALIRAWWSVLVSVGLALFVLAFILD